MWLSRYATALKRTGKLNLMGERSIKLEDIKPSRFLKELNVSRTGLRSLAGMQVQPKLDSFIADNSQIETLENFAAVASCSRISLKGTPVAKKPHLALALFLISGKQARVINGQIVKDAVKKQAEEYPDCVAELLTKGWPIEYPCPSNEELSRICMQYGVEFERYEEEDQGIEEVMVDPIAEMQEQMKALATKHDAMIQEQLHRFGITKETFLSFEDKLTTIFHKYQIPLQPGEDGNELLDTIAYLCEENKKKGVSNLDLEE